MAAPTDDLARIEVALDAAEAVLSRHGAGRIGAVDKATGDPVTAADLEIDAALRTILPTSGEGWLSEETADDARRLGRRRVWVVDPLDGTREFVNGLPEYCVSVGLVVDGRPVAGGVSNPAAGVRVVGAVGVGVRLGGRAVGPSPAPARLAGLRVLASRSEVARGEWVAAEAAGVEVVPMGSVAYKLARVAAGLDPATWTLSPKHEWDVAGGAALLAAGGGSVVGPDGSPLAFNQVTPWFPGVIAVPPGYEPLVPAIAALA